MAIRTHALRSLLCNASAARIGAGLCIVIATMTSHARGQQTPPPAADAQPQTDAPSTPPPSAPQQPSGQAITRQPVLDSSNQGQTPMNQLTLEDTYGVPFTPDKVEKKFPFLDDAKWAAQARGYYFYKDNFDDSLNEAFAIGGSLGFKSGYLGNVFAIGAVGYISEPVYAPSDRGGTGLLEPDQEGFIVLGQIYGEIKITDALFFAAGRKEYNTPYVNKNDTRMVPNTFEGASFYGKAGGGEDGSPAWRYGAGYLSQIKERNTEDFVWMSHDAGALDAERGVVLGGANVDYKGWSFGAIDYYCADVINIFYTEAKYQAFKNDDSALAFGAQYSDQVSVGQDRLTGDDFSTRQFGIKGDYTIGSAIFTLAYTIVNGDADMRSPWGGYPGYTSVQVQDFFREGENAAMIRAGYDFTDMGLKGLSAYALYVYGFNADDSDQDEIDFNVQWTPTDGPLRGMSYRMRYAYVSQRGDGDPDVQEFRFIVTYDFPRPN